MSNRFYIDADLAVNHPTELTEPVFHHWVRVLRAKVGDQAVLFNNQGGEYTVQLIEINKKNATISVESFCADNRTPQFRAVLGQVMSKGDRMDYAIQKSVELGVSSIQLLTSERCEMRLKYERDQKKIDHWQAVAIAACEQCGLNQIPRVLPPLPLTEWLQHSLPNTKFVLAPTDDHAEDITAQLSHDVCLLVGPEGGLSAHEIEQANQAGFKNWCIGERVLRTETAPVVALSILNFILKS
ncbi:16S rRNA (uracil(1498)-N(3))-methyltransferase [Acinetobacter apis]|uniref:Ribosomal RNA small subunit methyltransferase E n=1 Tax=Acinetobacter apis TaxID=1229165 RepID=A0A217EDM9_9GAMM|nr:16S rRNA (uracil(1498)-N(3))-methyltransferase [Acinetobacter apis]SNQ28310.1 16S rRNA (uracil1498-N3)-methyltransferase [Acinetobacter apis]